MPYQINNMLNPPKPKSIPLNSARAFEAAARLQGFKVAAEELNVTPGAVAQHIKSLEEWAGIRLFQRMAQGVKLTDEGRLLYRELKVAFDIIGSASIELQRAERQNKINIAALPAIAQFWLSPRLKRIRDILPEVQISLTALELPPNLLREPYDISIFFHHNPDKDSVIPIIRDRLFPVCSPKVAQQLKHIDDLQHQYLLHDSTWRNDWEAWLISANVDIPISLKGPNFSLYSLAIQEAQNSAGVLIGHQSIIQPYLEEGSLVAPFAHQLETDNYLSVETLASIRKGSLIEQIVEAIVEK